MARRSSRAERIVDAALELAETVGWEAVRLRRVAERLGISAADIRAEFRDRDAIADAWLARADAAMLAPPPAGFAALPARERLFFAIMRWLDALAGHRRVTAQMLTAKRYPGHLHHNVALLLWLSRTVQWLREAAMLDAGGRQRRVEEIGLSALFVATLSQWTRDDSPGQTATREALARRLQIADRVMARLWPPARLRHEDLAEKTTEEA